MKKIKRTLLKQTLSVLILCLATSSLLADSRCAAVAAGKTPSQDRKQFSEAQMQKAIESYRAEVKALPDPKESLLAKIMMLRRADKSIDISVYIFRRDEAGYLILNEAKEAMKRGVKVRILIDSLGSFHVTHAELLALFHVKKQETTATGGIYETSDGLIEIVTINPPAHLTRFMAKVGQLFSGKRDERDNFFKINNRSHDKILMIDTGTDNMMAVIGGRNISNEYYGINAETTPTMRDYEVIVKPSKSFSDRGLDETLAEYYNLLFFHRNNRILSNRLYRFFDIAPETEFQNMEAAAKKVLVDENWQADLERMEKAKFLETGFSDATLSFVNEAQNLLSSRELLLADKELWEPQANRRSITRSVDEQLANAKSSVEIVTPFPVISTTDILRIKSWLLAHPLATFKLYSNSTGTSAGPIVQAFFDQFTAPQLMKLNEDPRIKGRVKVYSYFGELGEKTSSWRRWLKRNPFPAPVGGLMHAKILVIDGKSVLVTTSNFDPRSRIHNSEMGFWIEGDGHLADVNVYMRDLQADSFEWGSKAWSDHRQGAFGIEASTIQLYIYKLTQFLGIRTLL